MMNVYAPRLMAAVVGVIGVAGVAMGAGDTRYHVRPYVQIGFGEPIDGLKENSDTYGKQGFTDAARAGRAEVDISTGTLKAYNEINVPGGQFVVALAEFSETFTFIGNAGKEFTAGFGYDGWVRADALSVPTSFYQFEVNANFAVFPGGVADWDTWFDLATNTNSELYYDSFKQVWSNPTEDIDELINGTLSKSFIIPDGLEQYHVFARIQIAGVTNSPQHLIMDFENTGTLVVEPEDPNVVVYSNSGVFPGTVPVPEPGVGVLTIGVAGAVMRRRR